MSASHAHAIADLRMRLLDAGYEPVPIMDPAATDPRGEPARSRGKRPVLPGWQTVDIAPEEIRDWAQRYPRDINTGLRCGRLLGVDVDILDAALAAAVEELAIAMLGPTPLRRIGNAPKMLLAYAAPADLAKMETPEFFLPDGSKAQVEVLAKGQQFVSHGIHPDTRRPYQWTGIPPERVPLDQVPIANVARLRAFLAAAESLIRDAGGAAPADAARDARDTERARRQPPPPGAAPAPGGGFFRDVNSRALADTQAWVQRLFPRATWQANAASPPGMWRVASVDLGRGLEEDISIHPERGCQDFGTRQPRTPIDLVMEHGGAPDATAAALWLCEALRVAPEALGWRARAKPAGATDDPPEADPQDPGPQPEAPPPPPRERAAQKPKAKPLGIHPATLRDPTKIPPREWLYGVQIVRRYVTLLIAPGGVGKTAYSVGVGLALAAGKPLLTDTVHHRVNTLFCGLEDPEDELDRRIAAAMISHRLDAEELQGRVFVLSGRDRRLTIAALDVDGFTIAYPDKEALRDLIRDEGIGAVFVDPFVNSHELDENSNPHINAAARAWAELAEETGCAIVLVHHTRKGAVAGDAEGSRGASALIGAARAALTLSAMSPEEAEGFGISPNERRRYIRLDDAKANLAPPSEKARWFQLASIALGNGNADYPNGDNVQAVRAWEPPDLWKELTPADLNRALDEIAAGLPDGRKYAPSRRGRSNTRWAGNVLVRELNLTDEQAAKIVAAWLREGLLEEVVYLDPITRKDAAGVAVNNARRPG